MTCSDCKTIVSFTHFIVRREREKHHNTHLGNVDQQSILCVMNDTSTGTWICKKIFDSGLLFARELTREREFVRPPTHLQSEKYLGIAHLLNGVSPSCTDEYCKDPDSDKRKNCKDPESDIIYLLSEVSKGR